MNNLFENINQNKLLGNGCPCEGCHKRQRDRFIAAFNQLGFNVVQRQIANVVLSQELTFELIAGLDIAALWLNGRDLGGRLFLPVVLNEPTQKLLEVYRPKLRSLIVKALLANNEVVNNPSERNNFKNLLDLLQPVSVEAYEKALGWINSDALNRSLDVETIEKTCQTQVNFKQSIDISNESFEERWNAYWTDGFLNMARHYFNPRVDAENLISHLSSLDISKRNEFFAIIPKEMLRWKRFGKSLPISINW
jgi:hypothetical protein